MTRFSRPRPAPYFRRFSAAFAPLFVLAAAGGCATTQDCPPAGIKTVYQTVTKEVQVPCKVTIPKRPGAVIVKPGDDANAVALRQKAVLEQWGGAGESFYNLAVAAIKACQSAGM